MKKILLILLCVIFWICVNESFGQSDSSYQPISDQIQKMDAGVIKKIHDKYAGLQNKLITSTDQSVDKIKKKEAKIRKLLSVKDSLAANQLFGNPLSVYNGLVNGLKNAANKADKAKSKLKDYIPGLDSLQSAFVFLNKAGAKLPGIAPEKLNQIKELSLLLKNLQTSFSSVADLRQVLKNRESEIKIQLDKYGLGKELQQWNRQAYYYQQQIREYKETLKDPDKIERGLLTILRQQPSFKDFMAKNSQLSQFFSLPGSNSTQDLLPGLQTRAGIEDNVSSRVGGGVNPQAMVQEEVQKAQAELVKLKDKLNQLGGGTNSDMIMPMFAPNQQKKKSFLKRIEYGFNIQSQKSSGLLPVTSDFALTAGYKLNDKSVLGIGVGYKMGWGTSFKNISLSSQGMSLRSYTDVKLKGSVWITGGYELNYLKAFTQIDQLKDQSGWQKSGLIGLTKKYKFAKKNGNLQLLWDFLSYGQVPQAVPLKFRIGYSF